MPFGVELTDFTAGPAGVTTVVADRSGRHSELRADYLIPADGAGSGISRALGVPCWELPPTHQYINVYFSADLAAVVAGRRFSRCEISDDERGLMLSKYNTDPAVEHSPTLRPPGPRR